MSVKLSKNVGVNTKLWDQLVARLPEVANARVRVGVLADKGGQETQPGSDITMIELAAIHEFGTTIQLGERSNLKTKRTIGATTIRIPERSFIRSTFERAEVVKGIMAVARRGARELLVNGPLRADAIERALGRLGLYAATQIRDTIRKRLTTGPEDQANAPSTIAKKKSTLPLVDTGRLINAVSWIVTKVAG